LGHLPVFIGDRDPAVKLRRHILENTADGGDEPITQVAETAPHHGQGQAGAGVIQQAGESAVVARFFGLGCQPVGQRLNEGIKLLPQLRRNVGHDHPPWKVSFAGAWVGDPWAAFPKI